MCVCAYAHACTCPFKLEPIIADGFKLEPIIADVFYVGCEREVKKIPCVCLSNFQKD